MTRITLPASDAPRVSIVVLCRRNPSRLRACLTALAHDIGSEVAFEVVILLNGPEQDVTAFCEHELLGARVEHSRVNLGFPAGTNRAAACARGELLVLLNDDTEIQPRWLESLIEAADENPRAGAIGSRILFPDGSVQEAGGVVWNDGTTAQVGRGLPPGSPRHLYRRPVDYCSAASLLVRRSTWELVAGLDEGYTPGYYEDVDLCLAIHELGQQVLYEPRSRVVHHESGTLDDGLKALVAERNVRRLRSKWSAQLATHETGGPVSSTRVDYATLRAQGRRRRILVLGEPQPAAAPIGELRSAAAAVTLLAEGELPDDPEPLGRLGCDIIEGVLMEHLTAPEILYDAVILCGSRDFGQHVAAIREHQPQAAVIHDARGTEVTSDRTALEAEVDEVVSGQRCAWADVLARAKSKRVNEYV